ncbi:MAG: hypothetical protein KDC98_13855 [Planctomycetes bacterium]|nr:hypothetical protein [Planctomycetota bacterium]
MSYQVAVAPQTQTNADTAFVSAIIDMADLVALEFVIMLGTLTDADVTGAVLLEEGDASDLSDNTAVADIDMLPTPNNSSAVAPEAQAAFTFADDGLIKKLGYVGTKRYVRLTVTPTGNNSGALPIAVLAVGKPRLSANVNGS